MPVVRQLKTGVYGLRNRFNRKIYVGSATRCLIGRWKEHRNALIAQTHFNRHLQAAWNSYGGDAFEFVILERCSVETCLDREQHWIDWFKSYDRRFGYNSRPRAESNLGHKFGPQTEEHKEKKAVKLRGRKRSPEVGMKIANSQRGKKKRKHSEEANHQKSLRMKGHTTSEETRRKIGEANAVALLGYKHSAETKAKLSAARKGKKKQPMSEQSKHSLSLAKRGIPWSQARRDAQYRKRQGTGEAKCLFD